MSKPSPHPAGQGGYPLDHLNKSYMSHGLNKGTRTYGGGSGYDSSARRTITGVMKTKQLGYIAPKAIVKTVVFRKMDGKLVPLKKDGLFPHTSAFKMGFVHRVEYFDAHGEKMTILNVDMR